MLVKDLMQSEVLTARAGELVADVLDRLVQERIHSAPVVDEAGDLIGMITLTDVLFGGMTRPDDDDDPPADGEGGSGGKGRRGLRVDEIMTSPAVSVGEEAGLRDLCRMMSSLGIHRVPVTRGDRVVGIVSSLDICEALASGRIDEP